MENETEQMSGFAQNIMDRTYAHDVEGRKETWPEIADRVTKNVMRSVGIDMRQKLAQEIRRFIIERKFIPAGRYLYASGRQLHQIQNCLLLKVHDSREGWSELLMKASMALMSGAGIGCDYSDIRHEGAPIRKTGGTATGPISLMQILNECGRGIMQGGNRRSAIWAGLRWSHPDVYRFIRIKNWSSEIHALKAKDHSFPAILDFTNICVQLDDEFFEAYGDDEHERHALAHSVYWATVEQMLQTGEPGFSIDIGKNTNETLRNACGELSSRDTDDICVAKGTPILTKYGWKIVENITTKDQVAYLNSRGKRRYERPTYAGITKVRAETLEITVSTGARLTVTPGHRISCQGMWIRARDLLVGDLIDTERERNENQEVTIKTDVDIDWFALGWFVGDGWYSTINNLGVCAGPTEAEIFKKISKRFELWTGGRIGYQTQTNGVRMAAVTSVRAANAIAQRWGLKVAKSRVKDIPQTVWLASRSKKAAFLAGLFASDGTVKTNRKNVSLSSSASAVRRGVRLLLAELGIRSWERKYEVKGRKSQGVVVINGSSVYKFARLVGFGIHTEKTKLLQVKLRRDRHLDFRLRDTDEIIAIKTGPRVDVYDLTMPSHSFVADTLRIHNCNLGSINMSRIENLDEFKTVIDLAMAFLLAGTVYSDVPYSDVDRVRSKNRRLGLGLMGIHEWLLKRDRPYAPDEELGTWLTAYAKSGRSANKWADEWGLSRPKKTRAIAPNGTTSIVAETTSGIEPIFCVAYKRRYLQGEKLFYQYVVDPCARRLIDAGADPNKITDAYTLARDVEKRVAFQAWIQGYVDHCISSTINLPAYGSEWNNQRTIRPFGSMLMRYLPQLRGITCYPDGSRAGQPLTPVSYEEALAHEGAEMIEESTNVCNLRGRSCSD